MNFLVDMNLTPSWVTPDALGGSVLAAIHQAKVELAAGAIISVDAEKARLRILPLEGR